MKRIIVITATAALLAGTALPAASAFADTTVYSNDFESNSTSGFSAGTIEEVPSGSTQILGEFADGSTTTLSLTGLASHSSATLSFTLDVARTMDGDAGPPSGPDSFVITTGGSTIFDYTFSNIGGESQDYPVANSVAQTDAAGISTLGYGEDSIYDLAIKFPTSSANLDITFAGDSNQAASDEFYGIDNVVVTIPNAVATPEPAALAVLLSGLFGLGFVRSRRARTNHTNRPMR